MSTVRELHNRAMTLANQALIARQRGSLDEAEALARQAYEFEAQAAKFVPEGESSEPTLSILYRSAASLAYQAKEYSAAQRLVAKGLSGYPPHEIEQELKLLFEQVKFARHLHERGIVLEDEELELVMEGDAVGPGVILYRDFKDRIEQTKMLVDKTIRRLMGGEYPGRGRVPDVFKPWEQALAAPGGGSFSITFKLLPPKEPQLPLFCDAARVIDEVLIGIDLINSASEQALRQRIADEKYYRQFVSVTQGMAPDGERIKLVGFTSKRKAVSLTRQRSEIPLPTPLPEPSATEAERWPIEVEGELDYATKRKGEVIGLTTRDGTEYEVAVQAGLEDLVRSYFGQSVRVTGLYDGTIISPTNIVPGSD